MVSTSCSPVLHGAVITSNYNIKYVPDQQVALIKIPCWMSSTSGLLKHLFIFLGCWQSFSLSGDRSRLPEVPPTDPTITLLPLPVVFCPLCRAPRHTHASLPSCSPLEGSYLSMAGERQAPQKSEGNKPWKQCSWRFLSHLQGDSSLCLSTWGHRPFLCFHAEELVVGQSSLYSRALQVYL